ncbi:MAG: uracil-DNA glycosylase [Alphaproteobacteria bacterium]|nr:uracil-DNA glycosylase [Alphaproteobacteria bacterium]
MNNEQSNEKILQWLVTAGADETIGETPVNRFALPAQTKQPEKAFSGERTADIQPSSPIENHESISLAQNASSLEELRNMIAGLNCPLKTTAANLVFGAGNPEAKLMIIGEAPGAEEDRQGLPFVGASGHLLDLMLGSIGLKRSDVYITNILPWRPPGNRKPSENETALLTPFVRRHIALIKPRVLLLLGGSAVAALMNTNAGITKMRGRWLTYTDADISVQAMASFHPAFLLRTPAQKKLAWRDFLAVREKLNA